MTRRQRNWAFWILVFSLNLIPLVAQGEGKDKDKGKGNTVVNGKVIRKTGTPAAPAPKEKDKDTPAKPADPTPAPPTFTGAAHDLTLADITGPNGAIMDFDARIEGPNPNNTAKLLGRIFSDCRDLIEVSHLAQAPGCGDNAAFRVRDKGGFQACMKAHRDRKDLCAEDSSSPQSCVFIGELNSGGGKFDLSALGKVEIQLVHKNPNGNEDHQNVCEDFPTKLRHLDQASMTAAAAAREASARQAKVDLAQAQLKNCKAPTDEQLQIRFNACDMLASLGEYESKDACVKEQRLDKVGIQILVNRASRAPLDELGDVTDSLINWANDHAADCDKVVEPLHLIAKRLATQQIVRNRNSERSPLDGYDSAIDTLQNAMDGASCLNDNVKLAEMQENLQINRIEKIGEISGLYSQEFRSQYFNLMQGIQQNFSESCTSWEMDPACSAATRQFQSASAVQQMVSSANRRQAESQAAMCKMLANSSNGMALPPNCSAYGYGGGMGMGMMGYNTFGYGGVGSSTYGFGRL